MTVSGNDIETCCHRNGSAGDENGRTDRERKRGITKNNARIVTWVKLRLTAMEGRPDNTQANAGQKKDNNRGEKRNTKTLVE
ncbi:hypothetical protein HJO_16360 [Hyphomonas johnsonii MHS-2]|uniref:Uncharacterized protein n=1 Tax=Hyphomonas johnsonii MHS-2 TaxID=1280950 RepID=A0A059FBI6_9PROT|nr:hypothetical protein HJO_16360 [Hyphomonas johnsonii MHS-2]